MNKKRTGESLKDLFKKEISSKEPNSQTTKSLKRQDAKTLQGKEEKPRRVTRRIF